MPDAPTAWEMQRRLDDLARRLDERTVTLSTYQAERKHDRDEVKTLRDDLVKMAERVTWAWRAAITGILLPIIVSVLLLAIRGWPVT